MPNIDRSALVSYSAEQMYILVNDVEKYPQFMPGCVGAKLLQQGDGWLEARLNLSKAGVTQSFVTRNTLTPPVLMKMELVEGPFSRFVGEWQFKPLSDAACKVHFRLQFELKNRLIAMAANKVLENIASQQVDCLCRRAKQIYG